MAMLALPKFPGLSHKILNRLSESRLQRDFCLNIRKWILTY